MNDKELEKLSGGTDRIILAKGVIKNGVYNISQKGDTNVLLCKVLDNGINDIHFKCDVRIYTSGVFSISYETEMIITSDQFIGMANDIGFDNLMNYNG